MIVRIYCGEWVRDENGEQIVEEYVSPIGPIEEKDAIKFLRMLANRWLMRVGADEDSHGVKMKLHVSHDRVELGTISEGYYQRYEKVNPPSPQKQPSE